MFNCAKVREVLSSIVNCPAQKLSVLNYYGAISPLTIGLFKELQVNLVK